MFFFPSLWKLKGWKTPIKMYRIRFCKTMSLSTMPKAIFQRHILKGTHSPFKGKHLWFILHDFTWEGHFICKFLISNRGSAHQKKRQLRSAGPSSSPSSMSIYGKVVLFSLDFQRLLKPFCCAGKHLSEKHNFPWDVANIICCRTHRKQNVLL